MSRVWKCDKCNAEFKEFAKNLVLVRAYTKSQKRGGVSNTNHICMKCMKSIFD